MKKRQKRKFTKNNFNTENTIRKVNNNKKETIAALKFYAIEIRKFRILTNHEGNINSEKGAEEKVNFKQF